MALKTFVKISGVNNLSDARYCAGMGANLIGFNIDPKNTEYITPEKFEAITGWISGIEIAGEFNASNLDEIKAVIPNYQLDYLQVNNEDYLKDLKSTGIPLIYEIDVLKHQEPAAIRILLERNAREVDFFLIQSMDEYFCQQLHAEIFEFARQYPVVLGCGINPDNVLEIINNSKLKGIGLKGTEEIKAGYKDFDELSNILELLEV